MNVLVSETAAPREFTPWPEDLAASYRADGLWGGITLGRMLRDSAARHGARTAVIDEHRVWSYAELDREADRLAAGLVATGIAAGERVIVQLPNGGAFLLVCFALFRIGAVPILVQPTHRDHEIRQLCRQGSAVALVIPDRRAGFDHRAMAERLRADCPTLRTVIVDGDPGDHLPLAELPADPVPLPDPDPGSVALLQLSGGTTAIPKLIPRTHDDYLYNARASLGACPLEERDVYLCGLPVAHNFPLCAPGVLGALDVGATVVLARGPGAEDAFPLIERYGVTVTAVVPPIALLWLEAARDTRHDLSSLRVLQVGGARLKRSAAAEVGPVLGCRLQQVFGMAEGLICYTRLDDPDELVESTQGVPMSEADEVLVVDDEDRPLPVGTAGHLLTRGPYTIRGYFLADEHNALAFTTDGYYRTGDIVRQLPSGHLMVVDRAKDLVNRGGDKVAADEVEEHLMSHPEVRDAAVVAEPDAALGERICAFVVPRSPLRSRLLRAHLRDRGLAGYKIPDRFVFEEALPLTGVGKIDKKTLRARAAALAAEEGRS
ncbi:(2,3-dihydroxybenzoyl)adenylate synthase [Streptomyces profundus]|uniref:(2,3-dihydroxybenzoyl)adenylate synthase n=1 Tax=Streptomyces profundus TaxID=2867410 RepID=UPI001D165DB6|nr:AMP-binding protein [Streptomyces sp. MA3_2.13]UED88032.1 AMP-binding protein [Streptomyces sp. MA3_2.13]